MNSSKNLHWWQFAALVGEGRDNGGDVWWGNRVTDSSEMYTCLHLLSSTNSSWSSFISPTGLLSARHVSHVLCDFSNWSLTPSLTRCWSRIPQAYVLRERQCEMNARENTTCFTERQLVVKYIAEIIKRYIVKVRLAQFSKLDYYCANSLGATRKRFLRMVYRVWMQN